MNITIFPKSPDKKGFVRLNLFVSINNKPGWFPTKIKVLRDSWQQEKQTVSAKQLDYKTINGKITERKNQLTSVFKDLDYEKINPSVDIVRLRYNRLINNKPKVIPGQEVQLYEYFDIYINERKNLRQQSYLRKFKPLKDWLIDFNPNLKFDDITMQFYNDFINHLIESGDLMSNTHSGYIKKIKSIMGAAVIDPRTRSQSIPIDYRMFKDTFVDSKPFWLDWETDLKAIEDFEPLEEDLIYKEEFLFRCYTGIRHSDMFNLKKENIIKQKGRTYIDFTSIKTRVDQNLQLSTKAIALIEKWKYNPPHLYQSDCNLRIKTIAKAAFAKAKIYKTPEKVRFKGSERVVTMMLLGDQVTTHTARRTFGRRWMENGGTLSKLSVYFGHSSEKITAKYVGWTTKEVNDEMMRVMG